MCDEPIGSVSQPDDGSPTDGAGEQGGHLRPRRRVLVVDDLVDGADSLVMLLRLRGHEALAVYKASAVLEAAEVFRPEVVLLDIGLAGKLSGYDLAPQLRRIPGLEGVLLVALTGFCRDEDKSRACEAGFDHHLSKPADPDALLALLEEGRVTSD
jgi:CheY-like chemotaxis protein